jgi:hypothetical protein
MSNVRPDLPAFCARLGLDETAVRAALAAPGAAAPHSPVYVQALLAIGAWIASILVIAFVLTVLAFVVELDFEAAAPAVVVVSIVLFAAGAAMQRGKPAGGFGHHFASALLAAGALMVPIAVGLQTGSMWAAAIAAALATAASALAARDRAAQFLAAALTVGLVAGGFAEAGLPYLIELAALAAVAGTLLLLYPPRRDLAPTAAVLLLFMPALMVVLAEGAFGIGFGIGGEGLAARVIQAALIVWLLHQHRALSGQKAVDATTVALGLVFVLVSVLLPPGGAAALTLMMLAFVLGLRGLAAIGVLFQIYFVSRFYYDLDATLLDKSLILMAVGVLALGAYALVAHRVAGAAR